MYRLNICKRPADETRLVLFAAAWFLVCILCTAAPAYEMEIGSVAVKDTFVDQTWTSVTFAEPFSTRPVVVALPTTNGSDPSTIRIRNVSVTGFEIVQVEPSANDGVHLSMDTAYLAVEPGNHLLPDGSRLIVLEHSTSSFASRLLSTTWDTVGFPSTFTGTPAIVAGIQTIANEQQSLPGNPSIPFLDVGIRNVSSSQLQITLERAESVAGAVSFMERIGIIAIDAALDISFTGASGNMVRLQSLLTPRNIRGFDNGCFTNFYASSFTGIPLSVASSNSRFGGDGGWVRRCSEAAGSIGLTVDEDIDNDAERAHTTESAGVIAASVAFHVTFGVDLLVSKNVSVVADPINGGTNPYAIPDADMQYVIGVVNRGTGSPDSDTLTITDGIPTGLRLCVTAACNAGGPVVLDLSGSPVPPGITLGTVSYSIDGGSSFTYTPIPDTDGFDAAIDAVRISLAGQLAPASVTGDPSFNLLLTARVN